MTDPCACTGAKLPHTYRTTMSLKPSCSLVFVLGALALLQGCASLLPSTTTNAAQFASFEEARMTIESLVPYQSDVTTLAPLGIDPMQQPNTLILTHSDIAKRVINGNLQTRDDLDKGIQDCLRAGDACRGWEIKASRIARVRTGSFFYGFCQPQAHHRDQWLALQCHDLDGQWLGRAPNLGRPTCGPRSGGSKEPLGSFARRWPRLCAGFALEIAHG